MNMNKTTTRKQMNIDNSPPKIIIDDRKLGKTQIMEDTSGHIEAEIISHEGQHHHENDSKNLLTVRKHISYTTPPTVDKLSKMNLLPLGNQLPTYQRKIRAARTLATYKENQFTECRHLNFFDAIQKDDDDNVILLNIFKYVGLEERTQYLDFILVCKHFKEAIYTTHIPSSRTREERLNPPQLFNGICRAYGETTTHVLRNVYESIKHQSCPLYNSSSSYDEFKWPMLHNYILVQIQNFIKLSCARKSTAPFNASDVYDTAFIFTYEFAKQTAMKMWDIILDFPNASDKQENMQQLLQTWYQWKGVNKTIREINRYITSYYAHHYCFPVIRLKEVSLGALSSHLSRGFVMNGAKTSLNEYMGYVFNIQLGGSLSALSEVDDASTATTVSTAATASTTTTTPLEIEGYNRRYKKNGDACYHVMEALLFICKLQKDHQWNNLIAVV